MGARIPTTATYIILVAVAAPALAQLNIEPLVAHFFVFYYGVLADITPPVALAAYAASGIAKSNPFQTGNTAFRLGIAKALVPFVFVFSPSLLLITDDFNLITLLITLLGAMIGIALIGIAFSGYWFKPLSVLERWIIGIVSLFFVAPGMKTMIFGFIVISPIFILQIMNKKITYLIELGIDARLWDMRNGKTDDQLNDEGWYHCALADVFRSFNNSASHFFS